MFTPKQLEYFESQAIPRSMAALSTLAQVIRQLQSGDALGNPLPQATKDNLEAQGVALFSTLTQAFAGLNLSIIALQEGNSLLIDGIIPKE